MRSVMSAQQMREVDKYMIENLQIPSLVLMENAAMGAARLVMEKKQDPCVVHVFCGTGNNGGDGLACARILLARGYDAYVAIVGSNGKMSEDAKANYAFFEHFQERVLTVSSIEDLYGWRVPKADVIVDAIFGTGLARDVLGVHADVISSINSTQALRVSLDIPSGIDADTGRVLGTAVRADCTATFQYPKIGHYLYPGREYTGQLRVVPIGIDKGVEDIIHPHMVAYESDDPDILIPERRADSNKGTYGRLLLLAGSRGMAGAAVLSARAAYAAGVGLVTVGAPWAVIDVMQNSVPEATCDLLPEEEGRLYSGSTNAVAQSAADKTAIALGPGLGAGKGLKSLISEILTTYKVCRVVDADALNALDKDLKVLAHIRGDVVFTPHPLEFARLLGTELHSVLEHPLELATAFAQKCRVTLVLKGATTIVAGPNGEVSFIAAGTPGMAKGGSGDVLTGVIAGLAAQGAPGYDAAVLGTYLCGMAGERAAAAHGEYSSSPQNTIAELGGVIEQCISMDAPSWSLPDVREPKEQARERRQQAVQAPILRTSAQRTAPQQVQEDPHPPVAAAATAIPAAAKDVPDVQHGEPAAQMEKTIPAADESDSVRQALNAISTNNEQVARPTSSHDSSAAAPEVISGNASAGVLSSAAPDDLSYEHTASSVPRHSSRGTRMSATDVRPPRIPRPAPPAATAAPSSVSEPTKVVEPLEETLASKNESSARADEAEGTSRQQKRAEKRRTEKHGRKLEHKGEPAPVHQEQPVDAAAEDRKREQLNAEIREELGKRKQRGGTRRRIG